MVDPGNLDISRSRDVLGQVAARCDRHEGITDAMEDQSRHSNRRQQVPDVQLVIGPHQGENGAGTCRCSLELRHPLGPWLVPQRAGCIDSE